MRRSVTLHGILPKKKNKFDKIHPLGIKNRRIWDEKNRIFIVLVTWWIVTCIIRHGLYLDSSDTIYIQEEFRIIVWSQPRVPVPATSIPLEINKQQ